MHRRAVIDMREVNRFTDGQAPTIGPAGRLFRASWEVA